MLIVVRHYYYYYDYYYYYYSQVCRHLLIVVASMRYPPHSAQLSQLCTSEIRILVLAGDSCRLPMV